ncbi:MAG: DUF2085 domain-containing protein [Anaerolineae bacterium]
MQKLSWFIPLAALAVLAGWLYIAPPGLLGKADAIGYAVCHRIDARSFHLNGRQLPLCARCTGEFNAAAVALLFQAILAPRRSRFPGKSLAAVLIFFFLAFAVDGSNSYLYLLKQNGLGAMISLPNLYLPNNTLRLFTGSGMGLAIAAVLYPVFNQAVWQRSDDRPALEWKSFAALLGIILIFDILILSENPFILYLVAVLSTLGVLALLSMVFSMVWIIIMRQENTFDQAGQLWLPALAGLTLALVLILSIDLLRLTLTGTWSGFPGIG